MKIIRLPQITDIHVHFRDPGETQKEDFYSGTCSALAGGVTTVLDMPNNLVPVFTQESLNNKIEVAQNKAVCDFGLYFGSDGDNLAEIEKVIDRVIGLKIYLSLTTGKYVIGDEDKVRDIFEAWPKTKPIVIHAEYEKVDFVIGLASVLGNKIHITHVANKGDLEKIISAKKNKLPVTCDVTPHHLFLTKEDLETLGYLGIMKPSLKTQADIDFLWNNLNWIDCIATDHAPHSLEEKQQIPTPTGVPGLETFLPLLLTAVSDGRLSFADLIRLVSTNPEKIFNLSHDNSTFTEFEMEKEFTIKNMNLITKSGWSPFAGKKVKGKVLNVYLHGKKVYSGNKIFPVAGSGRFIP